MKHTVIFWFRRDLRLADNHALFQALQTGHLVQPVFIFDRSILGRLSDSKDARVTFIWQQLQALNTALAPYGTSIKIYHDHCLEAWQQIVAEFRPQQVFCNRDYEPAAGLRDLEIQAFLGEQHISFQSFKDQVIFHEKDVVKADGNPYTVYTAYKNKWLAQYEIAGSDSYASEDLLQQLQPGIHPLPRLAELGFQASEIHFPENEAYDVMADYLSTRDIPSLENGTSRLGVHLRFGTISIRKLVAEAYSMVEKTFLKELIWREFFMMILYHFPHTVTKAFMPKYDLIVWRNQQAEFQAWCEGRTGYPLVDAGMRELNQSGFMHNRVRMLCASFLCKHLLIDWRWGEAYFAEKLLDYDQSANIGNWQWAAGCGTDAAPYFRIFSPMLQQKKFDPNLTYIKKWIPELGEFSYPQPIVDHTLARERCLKTYKSALNA